MAVTVIERYDSRALSGGDTATAELVFLIRGTADDAVAYSALLAGAPTSHQGLVRQTARTEPLDVDAADEARSTWLGVVGYGREARAVVGESSFSFDTSGGTQHITQSIQTVAKYAKAGQTAPDFKGAIGVSQNEVEGVDLTMPVYQFSETHILSAGTVDAAYKGKLFALTGRTNDAVFKGCQTGECLFLGARGSMRTGGDWEVAFQFAASPNRANFAVGDITVVSKKGWEYMWVRYTDAVDQNQFVKQPVAVYVERVYEAGDFAELGIGT